MQPIPPPQSILQQPPLEEVERVMLTGPVELFAAIDRLRAQLNAQRPTKGPKGPAWSRTRTILHLLRWALAAYEAQQAGGASKAPPARAARK